MKLFSYHLQSAKGTAAFKLYSDAERIVKLITQWFFNVLKNSKPGFHALAVDACYNIYFVDNMDSTTCFSPFITAFPIMGNQSITGFVKFLLTELFGTLRYLNLEQIIDEMNEKLSTKINYNVRKSNEMREHVENAIALHINIMK